MAVDFRQFGFQAVEPHRAVKAHVRDAIVVRNYSDPGELLEGLRLGNSGHLGVNNVEDRKKSIDIPVTRADCDRAFFREHACFAPALGEQAVEDRRGMSEMFGRGLDKNVILEVINFASLEADGSISHDLLPWVSVLVTKIASRFFDRREVGEPDEDGDLPAGIKDMVCWHARGGKTMKKGRKG